MIEDLHEDAAQGRLHFDRRPHRRCGDGEKTEDAVAEMVDRQVGNHSFQVRLRPGGQRRDDDGTYRQGQQPRPQCPNFARKEWQKQAHKTVNSHFGKGAGQHH